MCFSLIPANHLKPGLQNLYEQRPLLLQTFVQHSLFAIHLALVILQEVGAGADAGTGTGMGAGTGTGTGAGTGTEHESMEQSAVVSAPLH